jgi:Family of unknown function (DUF6279)
MFIFRLRSWVLIMLVTALLPACSAIKIAYNQAPDLTYWWLDSYVDFNSQQTPRARDEITRLFAWHRSSELPKVAALLHKMHTLMHDNITPAQACGLYNQGRSLVEAIADKALPTLADLAPSLTSEQLHHLERKYEKNNEENLREYQKATAEERAARRLKQGIERSEMLYGKLDEPQIAAIKTAIQKSSFDGEHSRKERLRRQQDALEMLGKLANEKSSPQQAQTLLRDYMTRVTSSPDPLYRAYADSLLKEGCASFAAVHASTTHGQRSKAVQILRGYEADLRALAAQK